MLKNISLSNKKFTFEYNTEKGVIFSIRLYDGIKFNEILYEAVPICGLPGMDTIKFELVREDNEIV